MNSYERIMEIMRKQGSRDNPREMQLGIVKDGKVLCGGQKLEKDDYLMADGLKINDDDTVLIYQISDSQYVIICKVVSS